ncbi:hypothetical protein BD779DRAFT_1557766 [Infundibulicybe gibba]|nr:hypothetical protein BD779DRAFT_1557766 [Infundibulicybe gibba]
MVLLDVRDTTMVYVVYIVMAHVYSGLHRYGTCLWWSTVAYIEGYLSTGLYALHSLHIPT